MANTTTYKLVGTTKWFDGMKGYGFITPDKGQAITEDIFVCENDLKPMWRSKDGEGKEQEPKDDNWLRRRFDWSRFLKSGDRVKFEVAVGDEKAEEKRQKKERALEARNVELLQKYRNFIDKPESEFHKKQARKDRDWDVRIAKRLAEREENVLKAQDEKVDDLLEKLGTMDAGDIATVRHELKNLASSVKTNRLVQKLAIMDEALSRYDQLMGSNGGYEVAEPQEPSDEEISTGASSAFVGSLLGMLGKIAKNVMTEVEGGAKAAKQQKAPEPKPEPKPEQKAPAQGNGRKQQGGPLLALFEKLVQGIDEMKE